jgi:hypothetical protein
MDQETKLLHNFERDSKWFHEHIDELRNRGFTSKFVAIKNNNVISSEKDMDILIESLEKKGENPTYFFIEFVYPEGFTLIL